MCHIEEERVLLIEEYKKLKNDCQVLNCEIDQIQKQIDDSIIDQQLFNQTNQLQKFTKNENLFDHYTKKQISNEKEIKKLEKQYDKNKKEISHYLKYFSQAKLDILKKEIQDYSLIIHEFSSFQEKKVDKPKSTLNYPNIEDIEVKLNQEIQRNKELQKQINEESCQNSEKNPLDDIRIIDLNNKFKEEQAKLMKSKRIYSNLIQQQKEEIIRQKTKSENERYERYKKYLNQKTETEKIVIKPKIYCLTKNNSSNENNIKEMNNPNRKPSRLASLIPDLSKIQSSECNTESNNKKSTKSPYKIHVNKNHQKQSHLIPETIGLSLLEEEQLKQFITTKLNEIMSDDDLTC